MSDQQVNLLSDQQAENNLPSSFVPTASERSVGLSQEAIHSSITPLVQSQSNSCSVATLGSLLSVSERDAYQIMSSALPSLTAPKGCDLNLTQIDPKASSSWLPQLMNMSNFVDCVNCSGRAVAKACLALKDGTCQEEDRCCEARFRDGLRQLHTGVAIGLQFDRATAGQQGGGHWSPVLAYHDAEDLVLVGDTAARYGHYWVATAVLCDSMRSRNRFQESRGWVLVRSELQSRS